MEQLLVHLSDMCSIILLCTVVQSDSLSLHYIYVQGTTIACKGSMRSCNIADTTSFLFFRLCVVHFPFKSHLGFCTFMDKTRHKQGFICTQMKQCTFAVLPLPHRFHVAFTNTFSDDARSIQFISSFFCEVSSIHLSTYGCNVTQPFLLLHLFHGK